MNRNSLRSTNSNEFMYRQPRKDERGFSPKTTITPHTKGRTSPYYTAVVRTPQQEADYDQYRLWKGLRKI